MQPQQAVHLLWAMSRMGFCPPQQYIEEVLVRVSTDCRPTSLHLELIQRTRLALSTLLFRPCPPACSSVSAPSSLASSLAR
jgi:hypothetical protein